MELTQLIRLNTIKSYELLLHPERFWKDYKSDKEKPHGLFSCFLIPGLVLVFLLVFIGEILFNSVYGILYFDIFIKALREVLILVSVFFVSHAVIYHLSLMFALPMQKDNSRTITAYTMTPLILVSMLTGLFPFFDFFDFFSIYSLFLAYMAVHYLFGVNFVRNATYLTMLMAALFVGYTAVYIILTKLTAIIFY
ncbi:MAG: Yip1 family protein [Prolixibacteraceae bacterium]|jgi:hypothetical protein|nr:Yip1 family protein [Prolixibacteraceae bacterium]